MPNTVRLHRVLATKPDKVYRAFIEADAMAKWLPPNGFTCTVHHLDAKVAIALYCRTDVNGQPASDRADLPHIGSRWRIPNERSVGPLPERRHRSQRGVGISSTRP
jgi:hypothetical protein